MSRSNVIICLNYQKSHVSLVSRRISRQGERYDDFGKAAPEKYVKGKDGYKVGYRSTNCVYAIKGLFFFANKKVPNPSLFSA